MREGQGELTSALFNAVSRDLVAPMVLTRQLTFELDSELAALGVASSAITEDIRVAVGEALELAAYMREIARMTSGVKLEPVQLQAVCTEADNDLRQTAGQFGAAAGFYCRRPRQQAAVAMADYHALKSLLIGLVGGAIRRGDLAGACDTIQFGYRVARGRRAMVVIDDKSAPHANWAQVLAAARSSQIVSPLASQPTTQALPLVVADRVVAMMGGAMTVRNRRHGGVSIELSLPLSQQLTLLGAS